MNRAWSLVLVSCALLAGSARRAEACVRAGEANKVLGWSADGAYALLAHVDGKGVLDHAEIHPTTYTGSIYVVLDDETRGLLVTKVEVGACASFGDEDDKTIVERGGKKPLTEASIRALGTVKQLKFGREDQAPVAGMVTPTATFTGKKRYDVHDLELTTGTTKTVMPVPVWCVGSCLIDESFQKWTATVDAVHALPSGLVLYEVSLRGVCHGGTMVRLIAPTPPTVKVPKSRCTGAR